MIGFLASVGAAFLTFLEGVGRLALFAGRALAAGFTPPYYPRLILRQIVYIGYFSLPVVGLTALFTGMVLALQSYTGFSRFNAEGAVATVVVLSVTRELGPVIAGLMVAGRVGAAMAAEIGTMRVTEQIDALTTLSTDPLRYLVLPRLLAGLLTLPALVLVADIIGVFGGFIVGSYKLSFLAAQRGSLRVSSTVCWKVGRFWKGAGPMSIPEATVDRLRSKHSGVGVLSHSPWP